MNQKTATVISEKPGLQNKILTLTAGSESNHYLALLNSIDNKSIYTIVSDFIKKMDSDKILTVISSGKEMSIYFTDEEGKSEIYSQSSNLDAIPISVGIKSDKPFVIGLYGRRRPGEIDTLKILSF